MEECRVWDPRHVLRPRVSVSPSVLGLGSIEVGEDHWLVAVNVHFAEAAGWKVFAGAAMGIWEVRG